jgi:A/G-specific adenine glycosylase
MSPETFQTKLLAWFDQHGRKDLPWQQDINPYRVWLSEIMLQQTQVATVIPYFLAFTAKFPTVADLAAAPLDDVLGLWAGLGYYARARNLHKTAQLVTVQGDFPNTLEGLMALPGIGRSTAGAILSIAFRQGHPILDGNVRRVLARFLAIAGTITDSTTNQKLWAGSSHFTPVGHAVPQRIVDYTQAMMDLGATVCTRNQPQCDICPLLSNCQAYLTGTVADFPTRKTTKPLPFKQTTLLLLEDKNGAILLEKRPALGIWGGLWSLPEFANPTDLLDWCMTNQITVLKQVVLTTKRHTFSHYHLDYTPVYIQASLAAYGQVMETNLLWCNRQQLSSLGLPAPIKQLLQQHFQQEVI